jgi:hypothetical protein
VQLMTSSFPVFSSLGPQNGHLHHHLPHAANKVLSVSEGKSISLSLSLSLSHTHTLSFQIYCCLPHNSKFLARLFTFLPSAYYEYQFIMPNNSKLTFILNKLKRNMSECTNITWATELNITVDLMLITGNNIIPLKDQNWRYDIHDTSAVQWRGSKEKHKKESW